MADVLDLLRTALEERYAVERLIVFPSTTRCASRLARSTSPSC